jgi:uncharacterized protein with FMN-binding domain
VSKSRRTLAALLGTATVALPLVESAASASAAAATTAAKQKTVTTRKLAGQGIDAGRWGTVTINVTVRTTRVGGKVTRKYTNLGGTYSYHTDRSQYIMSKALPLLREEFLAAQSANVQMISGATDTSQAFAQSLQSALAKL